MKDIDKYLLLIDEIAELYFAEKKRQELAKKEQEEKFFALCEELDTLYREELDSLRERYILPFLKKYPDLGAPSFVTEVYHKEKYENLHSSSLKYFFEHDKIGVSLLAGFCKEAGCEGEWLETIPQRSYKVEIEFPAKKQKDPDVSLRRIDLLIRDDENKWLVAIENKIDSKVRTEKGNQLKAYRKICNQKYCSYHREYVLLSHREDNRADAYKYDWKYINYYGLFGLLLSCAAEDAYAKEYLKILYGILFPCKEIPSGECASLSRCRSFVDKVIHYKH